MALRRSPSGRAARRVLAAKYTDEAQTTEDMAGLADQNKFPMVASNLKNIAQRKRTFATRATDPPEVSDAKQ